MFGLRCPVKETAIGEEGGDALCALEFRFDSGVEHELRPQRRLVGSADSRELPDFSGPRFCVQASRITPRTDFEWTVDIYLDEVAHIQD